MTIDEAIDIQLKELSKGKTVLDLGGYRGRECAVALQSGAKSAVCVDDESWRTYDRWENRDIYLGVEYIKDNLMNYNKSADIVILKNVIYHQRNPWATLEHARKLCKEVLLLTTSFIEGDGPYWMVYRPYEGHPQSFTVAWRPMKLGLTKLLQSNGFEPEYLVENDQGSLALKAYITELPIGFGERP